MVASVVALIQTADRIISACKGYITAVNDAPRDLRTVIIEVESVKSVLGVLELLMQSNDGDAHTILGMLRGANGPLLSCMEAITALDSLFPKIPFKVVNGKQKKVTWPFKNDNTRTVAILAWPFKKDKVWKYLADIKLHKATISLALTTESVYDVKDIKKEVRRLQVTLSDTQREAILRWFVITDPSSNHNAAWSLREPQTGRWLTRSQNYKDWIQGSTGLLWLHGIPGSGKTVLASYIVEEVKELCRDTIPSNTGWAYYYFYFRREGDEVSSFLRWVINQLCRQLKHIPNVVRDVHDDIDEPTTPSLVAALSAVVREFQRVYLVLDALDESSDRSRLLDVLTQISKDVDFKRLRILATSREEIDIERALRGIATEISLHNHWVDEDIRLYIQSHLRDNRKLSRWPEALKAEIEVALVKGAKGMFRWAFCQLDILGRLKCATDIRDALGQLPKTLDETYERILDSISAEDVKFARRGLHLLAFDFGFNTLEELAEAVVVDDSTCTFDPSNRFLDPKDILEICTCLVTYSGENDSQVRLAHYSVKEYLVSDRIKLKTFKTSEVEANILAAKTCITYYLASDFRYLSKWADTPEYHNNAKQDFPLLETACRFREFVVMSKRDEVVSDLVLKLFSPGEPRFLGWWDMWKRFYGGMLPELPLRWSISPGAEATSTLAYLCFFDLRQSVEALLDSNLDPLILENQVEPLQTRFVDPVESTEIACGTPLHVAATLGRQNLVELLISKGADPNALSEAGWSVLNSALLSRGELSEYLNQLPVPFGVYFDNIVEQLIDLGANPNALDLAVTPLQSAVCRVRVGDRVAGNVRVLLERGADVNAVGNDDAVVEMILYRTREELDPDVSDRRIRDRGNEFYYDTPLRIVDNKLAANSQPGEPPLSKWDITWLREAREILIEYGAKSLHLPPNNTNSYARSGSEARVAKVDEVIKSRETE